MRISSLNPQTRLAPKESFARFSWKHNPPCLTQRRYRLDQTADVRMGYEPPVDVDNCDRPRLYYYCESQPKYNASVANGKPPCESFLGGCPAYRGCSELTEG